LLLFSKRSLFFFLFFFEKKNQKTFASLEARQLPGAARPPAVIMALPARARMRGSGGVRARLFAYQ